MQNRLIQTSQTGGQWYNDTSPFSIPWFKTSTIVVFMTIIITKTTGATKTMTTALTAAKTMLASDVNTFVQLGFSSARVTTDKKSSSTLIY